MKNLLTSKRSTLLSYLLSLIISQSCRELNLNQAIEAYKEAEMSQIHLPNNILSNLLCLAAGLGEQGSGCTIIRNQPVPCNYELAVEIYEKMKNLQYKIGEAPRSGLIRSLIRSNRFWEALNHWKDLRVEKLVLKLRTYTTLLNGITNLLNEEEKRVLVNLQENSSKIEVNKILVKSCHAVFVALRRAAQRGGVNLTEREYCFLLQGSDILSRLSSYSNDFTLESSIPTGKELRELFAQVGCDSTLQELLVMEIETPLPKQDDDDDDDEQEIDHPHSDIIVEDLKLDFLQIVREMFDELGRLSDKETLEILTKWFQNPPSSAPYTNYHLETSLVDSKGCLLNHNEQLESIDLSEEQREILINQLRTFAVMRDPEQNRNKLNNKVKDLLIMRAQERANRRDNATTTTDATTTSTSTSIVENKTENNSTDSKDEVQRPTFDKKNPHNNQSSRQAVWEKFEKFISDRLNAPRCDSLENSDVSSLPLAIMKPIVPGLPPKPALGFDIVIDGANIGYYKQNFAGAPLHVDYRQIDLTFDGLRRAGFSPLIILHARHLTPQLLPNDPEVHRLLRKWSGAGLYSSMSAEEQEKQWAEPLPKGDPLSETSTCSCLYLAPRGYNDDWFSLYAALVARCPMLSNDELRDHHFQLLQPKFFTRWRERNRVQYNTYYVHPRKVMEDYYDEQVTALVAAETGEVIKADVPAQPVRAYDHSLRRLEFLWPLPYTPTLQYVSSELFDGYYVPPLISPEELARAAAAEAAARQMTGPVPATMPADAIWHCFYAQKDETRKRMTSGDDDESEMPQRKTVKSSYSK